MGGECNSGFNSIGVLPLNTWSYLSITYNGSNVRLYRNGVLASTCSLSKSVSNSDRVVIGSRSASQYQANARIDEVKIYNYPRTASQLIEDMNAGHPAPGSPVGSPIGYWKFDEGDDNRCSGGSNDACNIS